MPSRPARSWLSAMAVGLAALVMLLPGSAVASPATPSATAVSEANASAALTCGQAKRRAKRAGRELRRAKKKFEKARKSGKKAAKRKARKRLIAKKKIYKKAKKRRAAACKGSGMPAPALNHPPEIPNPLTENDIDYTKHFGSGSGVLLTQIVLKTPATDPDGDSLTYMWTVSVGEISQVATDGLGADWVRPFSTRPCALEYCPTEYEYDRDSVHITVTDGKGGEAQTETPRL
jgi:hypothetical protein